MTTIEALIARNVGPHYQNVAPLWWPLNVKLTGRAKFAWLRLPNNGFISYGLEPDYDERLVAEWGPLTLTRPETESEREEREEAEAEEAFMERELNRYTEWYY
jgi:hypothetical protein